MAALPSQSVPNASRRSSSSVYNHTNFRERYTDISKVQLDAMVDEAVGRIVRFMAMPTSNRRPTEPVMRLCKRVYSFTLHIREVPSCSEPPVGSIEAHFFRCARAIFATRTGRPATEANTSVYIVSNQLSSVAKSDPAYFTAIVIPTSLNTDTRTLYDAIDPFQCTTQFNSLQFPLMDNEPHRVAFYAFKTHCILVVEDADRFQRRSVVHNAREACKAASRPVGRKYCPATVCVNAAMDVYREACAVVPPEGPLEGHELSFEVSPTIQGLMRGVQL